MQCRIIILINNLHFVAVSMGTFFYKILSLNTLLQAGAFLTIANVLTGILGYGYQVIMGRMLTPTEFALFSSIMALTMFFSSPLGALQMVISRRVSSSRVRNKLSMLRALYQRSHLNLMYVGLIFLLILIPLMPQAKIWLRSDDSWPIWIFGFTMVLGAFLAVNRAYFQGNQWFGWLGSMGALGVGVKIFFSVLLVNAGFGVRGALGGALISCAFIWMAGRWLISKSFPEIGSDALHIEKFNLKEAFPVLIANIAFAAMTQLDMVLVNWFFPSQQAGMYAAASVLGKAVLYLPGGLVLALYPMVAENHTRRLGSARILVTAVLITGFVCGVVALVYLWVGKWLIALFYGADYSRAGMLLQWYGLAIFPMTLVMVAEHFLIAKGKVLFAWLFLAMAPLQVTAIYLYHDELIQVIAVMGICGTTMVVVGYGILWREYRRSF